MGGETLTHLHHESQITLYLKIMLIISFYKSKFKEMFMNYIRKSTTESNKINNKFLLVKVYCIE